MSTINHYFNVRGNASEQRLLEDLTIESIKISGMKVYYVPRTLVKVDKIFGEDPLSSFDKAFAIEMYLENVNGFEGDRDLISKFGLELRDKANFIVSRRRFNEVVRYEGFNSVPNRSMSAQEVRPMEGDLIYLPMTNDLFEIRFADHESSFYQWGQRYVWRVTVEKFEYSSETIQTGVPEIDRVQQVFENQDSTENDPLADNLNIRSIATDLIDFSESNPFGEPDRE